MRVFGKRGGAQRRTNDGRGWSHRSDNDVVVDLPSASYSTRSYDMPSAYAAPHPHEAHGVPSTGALALMEQLARELNGARLAVHAPAPTPAPYGNAELASLVSELRGEIQSLKAERQHEQLPQLTLRPEDREVFGLLAELRGDISALKAEQKRVFRREEDREVHNLLAELRSDIRALKEEQAIVERRGEDREVHNLLAALKSDIVALKREQHSQDFRRSEDREVHNLLAELKGDIEALKKEQTTHDVKRVAAPANDVQNLLASLKSDLAALKIGSSQPAPTDADSEVAQMLATLKSDIDALKQEQTSAAAAKPREPLKRITRAAENEYFMLADAAISEGDLSGARRLYNAAINEGSLAAILELARSFDPAECNQFGAGDDVEPDRERAMALYRQAAKRIAALIDELE
jgi:hypothetical protein